MCTPVIPEGKLRQNGGALEASLQFEQHPTFDKREREEWWKDKGRASMLTACNS